MDAVKKAKTSGQAEPESLWAYIKYLRQSKNYSLGDFSKKLGVSYPHTARIEKPFDQSRITASAELLKKIAAVCAKDPSNFEERDLIEHKLLIRRAKILFSDDVLRDSINAAHKTRVVKASLPTDQLHEEPMPSDFIGRLQFDISEMKREFIVERLYITTDTLDRVLSGQLTLSRHRVADLARKLGQPEDEYLILAGYVPQNIKRILLNPSFLNFARISAQISNGELWRMGIALNSMYLLYALPGGKKREGNEPSPE